MKTTLENIDQQFTVAPSNPANTNESRFQVIMDAAREYARAVIGAMPDSDASQPVIGDIHQTALDAIKCIDPDYEEGGKQADQDDSHLTLGQRKEKEKGKEAGKGQTVHQGGRDLRDGARDNKDTQRLDDTGHVRPLAAGSAAPNSVGMSRPR